MDRTIKIDVRGSYIRKDNKVGGVQGEGNSTIMNITFDEAWNGLSKKVTFWNAKGLNPVERTLTADLLTDITESISDYSVSIPPEPLEFAGEFTYVIDGYMDGKRKRSVSDKLEVKYAPVADDAGEPSDPTPTQAEQLQKQIDGLLGGIQEERIAAEDAKDTALEAAENALLSEIAAEEHAKAAKASEEAAKEAEIAAKEADAAKEVIENMTVSGTNVPPDSETPLVEKDMKPDGSINMHFNMRQGVSGVYVGSGEMPEGFNVQVDYEEGDNVLDIYAVVEEAEKWANAAQAYAEQAQTPAVQGVYNVVLVDRVTNDHYALIVEGRKLRLLGVSNAIDTAEITLIDNATGSGIKLGVENGRLFMEEV